MVAIGVFGHEGEAVEIAILPDVGVEDIDGGQSSGVHEATGHGGADITFVGVGGIDVDFTDGGGIAAVDERGVFVELEFITFFRPVDGGVTADTNEDVVVEGAVVEERAASTGGGFGGAPRLDEPVDDWQRGGNGGIGHDGSLEVWLGGGNKPWRPPGGSSFGVAGIEGVAHELARSGGGGGDGGGPDVLATGLHGDGGFGAEVDSVGDSGSGDGGESGVDLCGDDERIFIAGDGWGGGQFGHARTGGGLAGGIGVSR